MSQLDPERREEKQHSDNCYCTLIKNLTGVWLLKKLWACVWGRGCWKSDYIPEAYAFARPPSLEGSATDVLGLRSKPWQNPGTIGIILIYMIMWQSTLAHTHLCSSIFVRTYRIMYYPAPYRNHANQPLTLTSAQF